MLKSVNVYWKVTVGLKGSTASNATLTIDFDFIECDEPQNLRDCEMFSFRCSWPEIINQNACDVLHPFSFFEFYFGHFIGKNGSHFLGQLLKVFRLRRRWWKTTLDTAGSFKNRFLVVCWFFKNRITVVCWFFISNSDTFGIFKRLYSSSNRNTRRSTHEWISRVCNSFAKYRRKDL